jgi:ABC-type branched-subunit amino acid transport system substrate-binding protein
MRIFNKTIAASAVCTAILVLAGCSNPPVVGVLLPTTGAASTYATSMKNAIDLAMQEAKDANELPAGFRIVWGDSATNPDTAAAEFERLVSEGSKIVVAGTTSGEAKALIPVIEDTNTICLSPSATLPSLTKDSKLFYRVFSSDELEGRRAGRFLRDDQGKESVVIFTEDSEQARGIEPPFRQVFEQTMNGKVMGRIVLTDPNWENEAADLCLANHPDSVYIVAYTDKTLDVLRMLKSRGFKGTICVTSAFYSGDVVKQQADLVDGIYFPQPAFDIDDERPLVQTFVDKYTSTYGMDPDIYAAHAYDAIRVVIKVVKETDILETSELRKTLQFGLEEFPGVTGIIQFNDYGDVHHNPIMFIVKDGQVRNYENYIKEEKKKIRDRIKRLLRN